MAEKHCRLPASFHQKPGDHETVAAVVPGARQNQRRTSERLLQDKIDNAAADALHQFQARHAGFDQPRVKGSHFFVRVPRDHGHQTPSVSQITTAAAMPRSWLSER